MIWTAEERDGLYYTVLPGRIPTTILRRSQEHAEETARMLNRIDTYHGAEETPA